MEWTVSTVCATSCSVSSHILEVIADIQIDKILSDKLHIFYVLLFLIPISDNRRGVLAYQALIQTRPAYDSHTILCILDSYSGYQIALRYIPHTYIYICALIDYPFHWHLQTSKPCGYATILHSPDSLSTKIIFCPKFDRYNILCSIVCCHGNSDSEGSDYYRIVRLRWNAYWTRRPCDFRYWQAASILDHLIPWMQY